jgi:putative endonuclease
MRKNIGTIGEQISVNYLAHKGYQILSKNYHCRYGEIDIVAKKEDVLVFIEVKTRTATPFEQIKSAISRSKQYKLSLAAQAFITQYIEFEDLEMRFDIILCNHNPLTNNYSVRHIPDAFDLIWEDE